MKYLTYPKYKDSGIEWIVEIPQHWNLSKLKYLCSLNADYGANIKAEDYSDLGARFLRTTDIDDEGLLTDEGVRVPESLVREKVLLDGDILLSRSGTIGRSFLFDSTLHEKAAFAGYLVRFRPNKLNEPKFLYYYSKSRLFGAQIASYSIESTIENFNGQKYSNLYVTHPARNEQSLIVKFLDLETNKISALVSKQQQMIELLKEKRQAIITHAVAKGLDPNVPVKDIGIEWIVEIPEHWYLATVHHGYKVTLGKMLQTEAESGTDELLPYLRASNIQSYGVDFEDIKEMYFSPQEKDKLALRKSDVLINEGGDAGRCAILERELDKYIGFQNSINRVRSVQGNSEYFLYFWINMLKSSGYIDAICNKATFTHYTAEKLKATPALYPPATEQITISNYLASATRKIDTIISKQQQMIELLKEHKTSLISQAVTGKIDVRGLIQEVKKPAGQTP